MLVFRDAEPDDYALVADSFWKAVRECPSVWGCRREFVVKMLSDVIIKPEWHVSILCDDNTPDEILCWGVYKSPSCIFWIGRKPRYKGLGFVEAMLKHIGVPSVEQGTWHEISCPILPPGLLIPAHKKGLRLVQRPYLSME